MKSNGEFLDISIIAWVRVALGCLWPISHPRRANRIIVLLSFIQLLSSSVLRRLDFRHFLKTSKMTLYRKTDFFSLWFYLRYLLIKSHLLVFCGFGFSGWHLPEGESLTRFENGGHFFSFTQPVKLLFGEVGNAQPLSHWAQRPDSVQLAQPCPQPERKTNCLTGLKVSDLFPNPRHCLMETSRLTSRFHNFILYSLIADDVMATMLVERTIAKKSFGNLTLLLCKTWAIFFSKDLFPYLKVKGAVSRYFGQISEHQNTSLHHWRPKNGAVPLFANLPLSHGGHIVPGDQKSFVLPRQSSPPMVSTARLGVVKQSSFGLPGQYGRRVRRANNH